jgi:hypothetical protein
VCEEPRCDSLMGERADVQEPHAYLPTALWQDKRHAPARRQAIDMAWLSAGRRSVGSAIRRQKARFLKALFGTNHTAIPERPMSSDDNEFEILMGSIGNRGRRERHQRSAARQEASRCRTRVGDRKKGWSGGRPLGVRARPHRIQPRPSVRRRPSRRRQGPGGPPSPARLRRSAAVGPRRLP